MKARLVRIGNSRGVRIPKPLIEQANLGDDVEIEVRQGAIVISRSKRSREGWAEEAAEMAAGGEADLLDPPASTRFDEEEWDW